MKQSANFLGLITLLILTLIFILSIFRGESDGNLVNPQPWALFTKRDEKETLKQVVEEVLRSAEGKYGVVVKNLKTGESYSLNEKEEFDAGSLYKLWVMATVFEKIKKGELSEDDEIIADVPKLNSIFNINDGDAELTEGVLEFNVKSALEQMITISHNYAAMALIVKVGKSQIVNFLHDHGFSGSELGEDTYTTTASDIASFYDQLYQDVLKNDEFAKEMVEILKRQTINDRLPQGLPEGISIAHKTADLGYSEHDGGIVFSPKGDYLIVVLSQTDFPDQADEKIIQISKAVYEYFNK